MTVTSGFFDSVSSDRLYTAAQMGSIFDGIISEGVFSEYLNALAPTANSTMYVAIGTGRAWFMHTWTYNDASASILIADAEAVLDRIDTIVLEVNISISTRLNTIKVIEGTPASTPVAPTLVETTEIWQYPLVDVYVAGAVTTIETVDLTDRRGDADCPFVGHLWVPDASETVKGVAEIATIAEINTGTDNTRIVSPDGLDGSARSLKVDKIPDTANVSLSVFASNVPVVVIDGLVGILIPPEYNGWEITDVIVAVTDKGVTGTTDVQVRRSRAGADVDVLSTKVTLGDEWYIADGVVNTANDDVATGDVLFVDTDVIHSGTAPNGLFATIELTNP